MPGALISVSPDRLGSSSQIPMVTMFCKQDMLFIKKPWYEHTHTTAVMNCYDYAKVMVIAPLFIVPDNGAYPLYWIAPPVVVNVVCP